MLTSSVAGLDCIAIVHPFSFSEECVVSKEEEQIWGFPYAVEYQHVHIRSTMDASILGGVRARDPPGQTEWHGALLLALPTLEAYFESQAAELEPPWHLYESFRSFYLGGKKRY